MPDKRKYADRTEYLKRAVAQRRKKLKAMLVEYRGGQCTICGYRRCVEGIDLHHIDSAKKEFGLSAKGITHSWQKMKNEAEKRILLCANCHREVHTGIVQLSPVMEIEKRGELRET